MRLEKKSIVLILVFAVLSGLMLISEPEPIQSGPKLPELPSALLSDITRVEIVRAGETTVLEKSNDDWRVVSPYKDKADSARINKMLVQFRKPIVMDAMVENGNHAQYGLDASNGIVVEVFESKSTPTLSFTLGNDTGNGASFIRFSGDTKVYRARVGGRRRFDFTASDWRNQRLLDTSAGELKSVKVQSDSHLYTLALNNDNVWELSPKPTWKLSQKTVLNLMRRLASTRIGAKVERKMSPTMTVTLQTKDDQLTELAVDVQESAFVQVGGGDSIYQVSRAVFKDMALGPNFFRDLTVYNFTPRQHLDRIVYQDRNQKLTIVQNPADGFWKSDPPGRNLPIQDVFFFVNSLSELNALSIISQDRSAEPSRQADLTLTLEMTHREIAFFEFKMWRDEVRNRILGVNSVWYKRHPQTKKELAVPLQALDPRVFEIDERFYTKTKTAFALAE